MEVGRGIGKGKGVRERRRGDGEEGLHMEVGRGTVTKMIMMDTRSTTGNNLRNIFLLCKRYTLGEITDECIKGIPYHPISDKDEWKVNLIREIVDIKSSLADIENPTSEECEEILNKITTM